VRGRIGGSGFLALVAVAFLWAAPPAIANPASGGLDRASEGVYVGTHDNSGESEIGSDPSATPGSNAGSGASGSSLPFTGFVAPLLLAAGLFAIALGAGMRTPLRNH
jgi:hypothetical protein